MEFKRLAGNFSGGSPAANRMAASSDAALAGSGNPSPTATALSRIAIIAFAESDARALAVAVADAVAVAVADAGADAEALAVACALGRLNETPGRARFCPVIACMLCNDAIAACSLSMAAEIGSRNSLRAPNTSGICWLVDEINTFILAATLGVNTPAPIDLLTEASASRRAMASAENEALADTLALAEAVALACAEAIALAEAMALTDAQTLGAKLATTLSGPSLSLSIADKAATGRFLRPDAMAVNCLEHMQLIC